MEGCDRQCARHTDRGRGEAGDVLAQRGRRPPAARRGAAGSRPGRRERPSGAPARAGRARIRARASNRRCSGCSAGAGAPALVRFRLLEASWSATGPAASILARRRRFALAMWDGTPLGLGGDAGCRSPWEARERSNEMQFGHSGAGDAPSSHSGGHIHTAARRRGCDPTRTGRSGLKYRKYEARGKGTFRTQINLEKGQILYEKKYTSETDPKQIRGRYGQEYGHT